MDDIPRGNKRLISGIKRLVFFARYLRPYMLLLSRTSFLMHDMLLGNCAR